QVGRDLLDCVDTFRDRTRSIVRLLVFPAEAIVGALQVATVDLHDAAELIQGRGELFLRRRPRIASRGDSIDQDVPLFDANRLERAVHGTAASADPGRRDECNQYEEQDTHQPL